MSVRACTPAAICCAERLGRILNYRHIVVRAGFLDLVVICRFAIQIDHDDRARQSAATGARVQFLAEQRRIDVPTCRPAIDENWLRMFVQDWVRSCAERQCRAEHLVAGLYIEEA